MRSRLDNLESHLERMENKMNGDLEMIINLLRTTGRLPGPSNSTGGLLPLSTSLDAAPRRAPTQLIRLPNGGEEVKISRLSSTEPRSLRSAFLGSPGHDEADTLL